MDRAYQLRFMTRVFSIVLVVAFISTLLAAWLLQKYMYSPTGMRGNESLIIALSAIATTLLFQLLLAIPLVFILSIRQVHRIVGPMNRLKAVLEAIGRGDFAQRITLRQGDALEGLAKSINQMAESLQQRYPR